MPTYSSALLPSTNGLTLGSSALRWSCFLQDVDIAGTSTIIGRFAVKNLEDIRFADQYTGTVTQQLDQAITDVGTDGGGLLISPGTMAAGSPSGLGAGGIFWLDLRGGFNIYQGSITTPVLALSSAGITSAAFLSNSGTAALTGAIRLANNDAIKWRVGILDKTVLSHASGTTTLGGTAISIGGATTVSGTLACTAFSATGQISSSLATGTAPLSITSTTVVPNLNVATLNGVSVSGSPTTGQSLVATGTTTATWSGSAGVYKVESVQYTPVTYVSSVGGTYFTYALPANELALNQTLRITASGLWTNTSGGTTTITFTIKAGATTLVTYTLTPSATSASNARWECEALAMCTASGSSGTVEVQGTAYVDQRAAVTGLQVVGNSATVALDTTSSQSLTVNVTQTNAGTISTSGRQFLVERLG